MLMFDKGIFIPFLSYKKGSLGIRFIVAKISIPILSRENF